MKSPSALAEQVTPQHEGAIGDLAPLVPGQNVKAEAESEKRQLEIGEDLHTFFLNLCDKTEKLNEQEWLNIKRGMIKGRNYFDGKQYGKVNDALQWVEYPKRPGEVNFRSNAYQGHIQTALTEISSGQTELTFSHIANDSRYGQMVAKIAEARYADHRRKLFKPSRFSQENISWLLNAIAIRYTYFAWGSGRDEKMPQFEDRDVKDEKKSTVCAICSSPREMPEMPEMPETGETDEAGAMAPDTDADTCRNCGSAEVKMLESPSTKAKVVVGYQDTPQGENQWTSVDPLGVLFYLHATTVAESPYWIWKQVVLKDILKTRFKGVKISDGIRSRELQWKYSSDAATSSANVDSRRFIDDGATGDEAVTEFGQYWFDYEMYCDYVTQHETRLRNGKIVPAQTRLGDVFPEGLYLAKNDRTVLDVWGENKNDKWTCCPYVSRLGTMVGAGTAIALDQQDIKNDLLNLKMASVFNDAFAKEFVNAEYIDPDEIPTDPTERGIVSNMPEGARIIGNAIDRLPATQLSPDVYNLDETNAGDMQMGLGTFAGNQAGAPDMKAVQDTAAGFRMWREMTVGRFAPMLSLKADVLDREQAFQLLINDQKYLTPKQWERIKGDYGAEAVKAFLSCNLREELLIEVVSESYMPQSSALKQAQTVEFGRFMTELQLNPNSEMGAYVASRFQIPQNLIGFDSSYAVAVAAIDAFDEIAEDIIGQFGDVQNYDLNDQRTAQLAQLVVQQANIGVSYELDDIMAMKDALRDWWIKDEGKASSNLLKASVLTHFHRYEAAEVEKRQSDAQKEIAAQQPMMEAQAAMAQQQQMAQQAGQPDPNAQAQAEAEKQQADHEHQAVTQIGQAAIQQEAANDQREHEKEMKRGEYAENEKEREHQIALAKMNAQKQKVAKTA